MQARSTSSIRINFTNELTLLRISVYINIQLAFISTKFDTLCEWQLCHIEYKSQFYFECHWWYTIHQKLFIKKKIYGSLIRFIRVREVGKHCNQIIRTGFSTMIFSKYTILFGLDIFTTFDPCSCIYLYVWCYYASFK